MPGPRNSQDLPNETPPQVRRFTEPCLLLLLHQRPTHGYDLTEALANFGMAEIDRSIVYRMLREMEDAGLIASHWDMDASPGPARRVYHLTAEGDTSLAEWVRQLGETDRILHHFLDRYHQHMQEGKGEFH
ncbi:MAG: hypothetical protein A2Y73_06970 [Chloroflexi bacterium RBG_13_56_8]|nr:MAG: hypothetical protein A2Y73_06970 [Chloroflexi bacterium RBG_13_56_8]